MTDGRNDRDGTDPSPQLETMAERLARLEKQLAAAPSQSLLEEQLAERVMTKLNERLTAYPQLPAGPAPAGYTASHAPTLAGLLTAAALSGTAHAGYKSWLPSLREFPLMARLYFDARYRVSRLAQLAVPAILAAMVFNYVFFTQLFISIPIVSPIVERLLLVMLAVVLYKVLSREAGRYAEVLSYLSRSQGKSP